VIYASSSSVYGDAPLPMAESGPPLRGHQADDGTDRGSLLEEVRASGRAPSVVQRVRTASAPRHGLPPLHHGNRGRETHHRVR
jgi:hypothetical protein